MADPLSVSSAVIGIAAIGFVVAKGLYQIADRIGSAGQEVRIYAQEIQAFSRLLEKVRSVLLEPAIASLGEFDLIEDVLNLCDRVLAPLNRLQDNLKSLLVTTSKDGPSKLRRLGARIQWVFSHKEKLLFYRGALRAQHRILDTILILLNLHAKNASNDAQNNYILQVSLENSMAIVVNCFSQSATTAPRLTFENQQRIDFPLTKRESFESDGLESHLGGSLSPSQTPTTGPLSFRSYASSSTSDDLSSIDDSVEQVIIETLGPDSESNESQLTEDMKLVSSRVLVLASDVLHASEQEARTTNSFNSDTEHLIALICESPFDLAVLKAMIDVSQGRITGPSLEDDNTYELGLIADHKVLILCLHTGYLDGEGAAAAVMRMFQSFPSIRVGIMVGVGGGVPSAKNDIRRRDVVVGMSRSHGTASHLHFDFDNHATDPKKTSVVRLPTAIATAIAALEAECILGFRRILAILDETLPKYPALQERFRYAWSRTDFMFEAEYDCQGQSCAQCDLTRTLNRAERPSEDPVVHFGSIASCAQVLRDPHKRDELGKAYNILCFETNRSELRASFPLLVVRGIEGYCDTHHSPVWKAGAMATAAAWTKELLQTMPLPRA